MIYSNFLFFRVCKYTGKKQLDHVKGKSMTVLYLGYEILIKLIVFYNRKITFIYLIKYK